MQPKHVADFWLKINLCLDCEFSLFFIRIKQSSVCWFVVLSLADGDVANGRQLKTEDGSSKRR